MASGQAGVAMEPRRSRSTRPRDAIPLPDLDYDPQKGVRIWPKWVDLGVLLDPRVYLHQRPKQPRPLRIPGSLATRDQMEEDQTLRD